MKILIGGLLCGYGNIGDEAILESDICLFEHNAEIMAFTNDAGWLENDYPNVMPILTKEILEQPNSIRKILGNIKKFFVWKKYYEKADIFMMGGSTALSDFPWHCLGQVHIASMLKIPSVVWGAGYVEVSDKKAEQFIKKVLNNPYVKAIYARDKNSAKRLCDIGVCRQKVDYCYDPVITMSSRGGITEEQREILHNGKSNVVICLSGEKEARKKTKIESLIELVQSIEKVYNVWLIPTGFVSGCSDIVLLQEINNKVTGTHLIKNEFSPRHLIAFLEQCDVVITSRLHMSIFSVCASVPFIALERSRKNKDFAEIMELPNFQLDNLNIAEIEKVVNEMIAHKSEFRKCIIDKRTHMKKRNMQMAEKVIALLRDEE